MNMIRNTVKSPTHPLPALVSGKNFEALLADPAYKRRLIRELESHVIALANLDKSVRLEITVNVRDIKRLPAGSKNLDLKPRKVNNKERHIQTVHRSSNSVRSPANRSASSDSVYTSPAHLSSTCSESITSTGSLNNTGVTAHVPLGHMYSTNHPMQSVAQYIPAQYPIYPQQYNPSVYGNYYPQYPLAQYSYTPSSSASDLNCAPEGIVQPASSTYENVDDDDTSLDQEVSVVIDSDGVDISGKQVKPSSLFNVNKWCDRNVIDSSLRHLLEKKVIPRPALVERIANKPTKNDVTNMIRYLRGGFSKSYEIHKQSYDLLIECGFVTMDQLTKNVGKPASEQPSAIIEASSKTESTQRSTIPVSTIARNRRSTAQPVSSKTPTTDPTSVPPKNGDSLDWAATMNLVDSDQEKKKNNTRSKGASSSRQLVATSTNPVSTANRVIDIDKRLAELHIQNSLAVATDHLKYDSVETFLESLQLARLAEHHDSTRPRNSQTIADSISRMKTDNDTKRKLIAFVDSQLSDTDMRV